MKALSVWAFVHLCERFCEVANLSPGGQQPVIERTEVQLVRDIISEVSALLVLPENSHEGSCFRWNALPLLRKFEVYLDKLEVLSAQQVIPFLRPVAAAVPVPRSAPVPVPYAAGARPGAGDGSAGVNGLAATTVHVAEHALEEN